MIVTCKGGPADGTDVEISEFVKEGQTFIVTEPGAFGNGRRYHSIDHRYLLEDGKASYVERVGYVY